MRAGSWQAQIPGHQVPGDSPDQARAQNVKPQVFPNQIDAYQIAADRFGDAGAEDCEGDKIESRRPDNRVAWRQHARRNYGGNGIRGVVKAVGEIENQRDEDD